MVFSPTKVAFENKDLRYWFFIIFPLKILKTFLSACVLFENFMLICVEEKKVHGTLSYRI